MFYIYFEDLVALSFPSIVRMSLGSRFGSPKYTQDDTWEHSQVPSWLHLGTFLSTIKMLLRSGTRSSTENHYLNCLSRAARLSTWILYEQIRSTCRLSFWIVPPVFIMSMYTFTKGIINKLYKSVVKHIQNKLQTRSQFFSLFCGQKLEIIRNILRCIRVLVA